MAGLVREAGSSTPRTLGATRTLWMPGHKRPGMTKR